MTFLLLLEIYSTVPNKVRVQIVGGVGFENLISWGVQISGGKG